MFLATVRPSLPQLDMNQEIAATGTLWFYIVMVGFIN